MKSVDEIQLACLGLIREIISLGLIAEDIRPDVDDADSLRHEFATKMYDKVEDTIAQVSQVLEKNAISASEMLCDERNEH